MLVNVDNIILVFGNIFNWFSVFVDYKEVFVGEGKLEEKFYFIVDEIVLFVILFV